MKSFFEGASALILVIAVTAPQFSKATVAGVDSAKTGSCISLRALPGVQQSHGGFQVRGSEIVQTSIVNLEQRLATHSRLLVQLEKSYEVEASSGPWLSSFLAARSLALDLSSSEPGDPSFESFGLSYLRAVENIVPRLVDLGSDAQEQALSTLRLLELLTINTRAIPKEELTPRVLEVFKKWNRALGGLEHNSLLGLMLQKRRLEFVARLEEARYRIEAHLVDQKIEEALSDLTGN